MNEIYAELSSKMLPLVENGTIDIIVPNGMSYSRKKGSRSCYFYCDEALPEEEQEALVKELTGSLDDLGINFQ
jgi:hypothetical protein